MRRVGLFPAHPAAVRVRLFSSLPSASQLSSLEQRLLDLPHPTLPGTLGGLGVLSVQAQPAGITVALDHVFPGTPAAAAIEAQVRAACGGLPVALRLASSQRPGSPAFAGLGGGLSQLRSAVAVASGKGGVGKSTVAVNLAFALHARGARVGLLDSDVQGPSLPTMLTPSSLAVGKQGGSGECINALDVAGVACASYGWVSPKSPVTGERGGAAVMRGPILATVVRQLAKFTAWGARDALVVDTPPGTGDVHLTLGQLLPFAGAVVVTTPQAVAMADTRRGLDMLAKLNIPLLALVLNMAHFQAPDSGVRYHPLGNGEREVARLARDWNLPQEALFHLPMEEATSTACDSGVPLVLSHPHSATARVFDSLAAYVAGRVERRLGGGEEATGSSSSSSSSSSSEGSSVPQSPLGQVSMRWDAGRARLLVRWVDSEGGGEVALEPAQVRRACRCAACIDEHTGVPRLDPASVPPAIVPRSVALKGNYGVAVEWSDGHSSSIYPLAQLKDMALAQRPPRK
jgi:Mrp family chromosome partitioning ATPase/DUF971 family protein